MPTIKDLENILENWMLGPDSTFKELKTYLFSEFNLNRSKDYEFLVRGLPIDENMKMDQIFKMYMPIEAIIVKEK